MSRADKRLTKISYEITLDPTGNHVDELKVITLCAQKQGSGKFDPKKAFSSQSHVAFISTYRFEQRNAAGKLKVPAAAAKLLK